MIKQICGFAGARVIAKSRTWVSEINSSSYSLVSPTFWDLCDPDFARSKLGYRGRRSRRLCKIVTFPLHPNLGGCDEEYYSFPGRSDSKESASNAGDPGSIPGWERSPEEGNGYPFQYSCLKNSMARGAWWATVHGLASTFIAIVQGQVCW